MVAPTAQRVHGIRTPDNRRLARSWRRSNRDADPDLVLSLVERLWSAESRDERTLGLEILYLSPEIGGALGRDRFDRWRLDIDNWAVCDFLATRILGPWADTDPESRGQRIAALPRREVRNKLLTGRKSGRTD
jgi:3-methyladenine DNA glycosylase AlkD